MLEIDAVVTTESLAGDIGVIALHRAPANALGLPLIAGLDDALDELCDAKVLVLVSRVPGFFAAGADIKHMSTVDADAFEAYGDALRATLNRLAAPERISIAAIDGLALGGGLELALACTLRVASARARLGLPEVKLGLIPGAGGTQRLPRLIRALDLMLTGREMAAEEALGVGLIDRLVDDAEEYALALATELRALSQPALHAAIRSVNVADDHPLGQGLTRERGEERRLFEHGEAREGIAAFLEKRRPRFA
jgi:enoyl-CoA hydratase/carnithine racemase